MKTRHQFIEDLCSPDRSGQIGTGNPLAFAVHRLKDQQGVSAIIVAITLAVLIGFAALAIDIGYLYATKNELQNIADAAALAGTNEIGDQWLHGETLDEDDIKFQIQDVSSKNQAADKYGISILDAEIEIGTYDPNVATKIVSLTGGTWPDAVRVTARRTEGANGAVATLFAKIFNIDLVGVAADATAALTGESTAEEGKLKLPVGISKYWYDHDWPDDVLCDPYGGPPPEPGEQGFCDQPIKFQPTGAIDGCAGWHIYDDMETPPNPSSLGPILEGMTEDPPIFVPPEATAGDTLFSYTGGTLSTPVFTRLQALFDSENGDPVLDDGGNEIPLYYDEGNNNRLIWGDCVPLDGEGNPINTNHKKVMDKTDGVLTQKVRYDWETLVVVYTAAPEPDDCSNPNTVLMVAGFSTVVLHAINDSNDQPGNTIYAKVLCDEIDFGRPGGGPYGTIGSIAGLVE